MKDVVFVTGNQRKADYLNQLLGFSVEHRAVSVDEIQHHDLVEVARHKAMKAFDVVKRPVLVEDVGLKFEALNGLPGPFIKFFIEGEEGIERCCRMLDGFKSRRAEACSVLAYYDGTTMTVLEGSLGGEIANESRGSDGWDWDYIFCPDGYSGRTRAELNDTEDIETYLTIKPIKQLKEFLENDGQ